MINNTVELKMKIGITGTREGMNEHQDLCYHEGHGQYFCETCWDKENQE
jgi:hypothetical protein